MASEWYYSNGDSKKGPVSSKELKSLATSGEITSETLLWKEGISKWIRATQLKGLFDAPSVTFAEWRPEEHQDEQAPINTAENDSASPHRPLNFLAKSFKSSEEQVHTDANTNGLRNDDLTAETSSTSSTSRSPTNTPSKPSNFQAITTSIVDAAKTAGQRAAKETERINLKKVVLPKLYWKLGKAVLDSLQETAFASEHRTKIDRLRTELMALKSSVPVKANTVGDKAKGLADSISNKAKSAKLDVELAVVISKFGREAFEHKHGIDRAPNVVEEIASTLARIAILNDEIANNSNPVWTSKPLLASVALIVVVVLTGLFLSWPRKTSTIPTNAEVASIKPDETKPAKELANRETQPDPTPKSVTPIEPTQKGSSEGPPAGWNPISSDVFDEINLVRPDLKTAAVILWRKWDERETTPNGFVHYTWKVGQEAMTVIYDRSGGFRMTTVTNANLTLLPEEMKKAWLKHIEKHSIKRTAVQEGNTVRIPRKEVKITANGGEVEIKPDEVKKEKEKLDADHEQWIKIIKTGKNAPLASVKGRELQVRINTAAAGPNQWWIPPRNDSLTATKCLAQEGEIIIGFHVDITKWQQMSRTRFPLLVRLFDKNGEYLTHFVTSERFTCSQDAFDDFEMIRNRFLNQGLKQEADKHIAVLLKPLSNELRYKVNVRDLRDAAMVEIGFMDVNQF